MILSPRSDQQTLRPNLIVGNILKSPGTTPIVRRLSSPPQASTVKSATLPESMRRNATRVPSGDQLASNPSSAIGTTGESFVVRFTTIELLMRVPVGLTDWKRTTSPSGETMGHSFRLLPEANSDSRPEF